MFAPGYGDVNLMGRPKSLPRSRLEILSDRAQITQHFLLGKTETAIAREMNLSLATVHRDLALVKREWQQQALIDMNEWRTKQVSRCELIISEALTAWRESGTPKDVTTTRQKRRGISGGNTDVPLDQSTEASKRTEQRSPNPAYLEKALQAMAQINDILGLNAPVETRHSSVIAQISEIVYEPAPAANDARLVVIGGAQSTNGHVLPPEYADDDHEDESPGYLPPSEE